jgi:hypothetical protein
VAPTDVDALVTGSLAALGRAGLTDSVPELFRHTELWLDDLERERVRNYVMGHRAGNATRSPEAEAKRRHRLLNIAAVIVAGVAAGLLAWWVLGSPKDTGTPVKLITPGSSVPSSESGAVISATPVVEPQPTTTLAGG